MIECTCSTYGARELIISPRKILCLLIATIGGVFLTVSIYWLFQLPSCGHDMFVPLMFITGAPPLHPCEGATTQPSSV